MCWRDEHGVVHIVYELESTRACTECGITIARRLRPYGEWVTYYTASSDAPTCIQCISSSLRPLKGFVTYEEVGMVVIKRTL